MTAVGWTLVALAGGYVALALYGKYRFLKDEYRQALEDEADRQAVQKEDPAAPV